MTTLIDSITIRNDVPIPTWFNCGGRAKRFAAPATLDELRQCVALDPNLKLLGDGANLLVADGGVNELVVALNTGEFARFDIDASGHVSAGAGVNLPKLINETVRQGLSGLETLGGIPASIGGAAAMNAGGSFGQFCDHVTAVHGMTRGGEAVTLPRNKVYFDYRTANFGHAGFIVTGVEFKLRHAAGDTAREKLKEVMAYKKRTQPMGEHSAGCAFKNPTLLRDIPGLAVAGTRVSAGMLIDKAGCKGMTVGGAEVSRQHANFIFSKAGCTATDVLTLMRQVRAKVHAAFDLTLENEVAIWGDRL